MYLVRDLELGVVRAVKELPLSCKREAKLLRLLDHQALPKMMDYVEKGEYCYLVMEYIRGKSLGEYLRAGRQFSLEGILTMAEKILDILEYLHSRKPAVCYGDLKPDNLMLTDNGSIYLVDFGSAQTEYEYGRVSCKGTPGYAAPEQLKGQAQKASDFYGLGKTIENLLGRRKWRYYLLFPDLGYFVYRCLCKDPEKRWENTARAKAGIEKIHPLKLNLKTVLIPVALVLLILLLAGTSKVQDNKSRPSLENMISLVTLPINSPFYRTTGQEGKRHIIENLEHSLQGMQRIYIEQEEQIRIFRLLIACGELQGEAKADSYYRQLISYEPQLGQAYVSYGNFLLRYGRREESRELYEKWKSGTEKEEIMNTEINMEELEIWEKEVKN